jgi:hypothetical protein
MFDEEKKAAHREKQFPIDLENAYQLGKRLMYCISTVKRN